MTYKRPRYQTPAMRRGATLLQAGKEEFFSPPPHTTGHAGPHPAVSGYFTELFRFVKDGILRMRRKVAQPYSFNALCEQHKALPCTGFGPSSCPQVSLRRLATMASADSCLSPAGFFDLLPTGAASDRSQVPEDIPLLSSWTLRPDYHKRPCRNAGRPPRIRT
jgi:hypothetical protein